MTAQATSANTPTPSPTTATEASVNSSRDSEIFLANADGLFTFLRSTIKDSASRMVAY